MHQWNPKPIFQYDSKYEDEDPIPGCEDGKWYFWDETWSNVSEGYNTEEEAVAALLKYAEELHK